MFLGQQGQLRDHNLLLQEKYDRITATEQRWETKATDDADMIIVSYGTAARIAESAVDELREEGMAVGLFRPITLWPFPVKPLRELARKARKVAVFELSLGQLVEDVILSVGERSEIFLYGVPGGVIPTPAEVIQFLRSAAKGDGKVGRRIEL
jgi:2-oxoglutarate ferredoxin oxidoreductase subunit alpha